MRSAALAVLLALTLGGCAGGPYWHPTYLADGRAVWLGSTPAEIQGALGRPASATSYSSGRLVATWRVGGETVVVLFENDRAVEAAVRR